MAEVMTRKLLIVGQEILYTGKSSTLYAVSAKEEDGSECNLDLRTFADLPKNELQDFTLKLYEHPEHGVSWTIQAPSGRTSRKVDELTARLAAVEERLGALERRLADEDTSQDTIIRADGF